MVRMALVLSLGLMLHGAALAENAPERLLEEQIVISPVIVVGTVGNAAGEVKDGEVTLKQFGVTVTTPLRTKGIDLKAKQSITVAHSAELKKGDSMVLFLSSRRKAGYHILWDTADAEEADAVKKMVAFEANAAKELDGNDKLRAAFFRAHQLRPVLLAEAENKGLKVEAPVEADEKEKLLVILGAALKEANQKDAKSETRALTAALQSILTGPGGLPNIRSRKERVAQFWIQTLSQAASRKRQALNQLSMTEEPISKTTSTEAKPTVPVPSPPKPPPPASGIGKPVQGLVFAFSAEQRVYNLADNPKQPIVCTATLKNSGNKPMLVNTYMIFPMLAKVHVAAPKDKKTTPYANHNRMKAASIPAMGRWSFKELKPGEELTVTEELPTSLFGKNGDYYIHATYSNSYGKQFGLNNVWTGTVASEKIRVTITRDQPEPEPEPEAAEPEPEPEPKPAPPAARIPPNPGPQQQRVQIVIPAGAGQIQIIQKIEAAPAPKAKPDAKQQGDAQPAPAQDKKSE